MGYFPNGTSGNAYQERYCERCAHDVNRDCAVWLAHLVTEHCDKDGETSEAGKVLDMLIPETENGIGCKQCKMFIEVPNVQDNSAAPQAQSGAKRES